MSSAKYCPVREKSRRKASGLGFSLAGLPSLPCQRPTPAHLFCDDVDQVVVEVSMSDLAARIEPGVVPSVAVGMYARGGRPSKW